MGLGSANLSRAGPHLALGITMSSHLVGCRLRVRMGIRVGIELGLGLGLGS